jgi:hypothetical protein
MLQAHKGNLLSKIQSQRGRDEKQCQEVSSVMGVNSLPSQEKRSSARGKDVQNHSNRKAQQAIEG